MQTIVRNAVLDLDNSGLSILPDKINVAADRNLLKIETSICMDVDNKSIGWKLWDYVLCSFVGTVITAIIGYTIGVLKASPTLIIVLYLLVGIIGIFLFLQWRRRALRKVKDDAEAKNKGLEQLTITGPKLIKPTKFEELTWKIMAQNSDKSRQTHLNNRMRDVIREIASAYYFLREAMGMEYIEMTLAEFESVQQQLLQMAVLETKKLRHFILNFFGYKTAWQYFFENKFFHRMRCPLKQNRLGKWAWFQTGCGIGGEGNIYLVSAYPESLYYDYFCSFDGDKFLKDSCYKDRTMPPNVLELANEIYSKRYDVENNIFVNTEILSSKKSSKK